MENQKTDKLEKLIEKIGKVNEQIEKETAAIAQAKQRLKTLHAQKKKIEKQIQQRKEKCKFVDFAK